PASSTPPSPPTSTRPRCVAWRAARACAGYGVPEERSPSTGETPALRRCSPIWPSSGCAPPGSAATGPPSRTPIPGCPAPAPTALTLPTIQSAPTPRRPSDDRSCRSHPRRGPADLPLTRLRDLRRRPAAAGHHRHGGDPGHPCARRSFRRTERDRGLHRPDRDVLGDSHRREGDAPDLGYAP